jgi:hypothetical protein
MNQEELNKILADHKEWLESEKEKGERANLQDANLRGADLQDANLRGANLQDANLQDANLQDANLWGANLQDANLRDANLRDANLRGADLQGADLRGANLDYSCWPLWCGSKDVRVDARIAAQIAYHLCRLDCDNTDYITARNSIVGFANTFHRVGECGRLKRRRIENEVK